MTEVPYLNVVPLPRPGQEDAPPQVSAATIEHLESVLELARRGEIVGIAMVPLLSDNTSSYSIVGRVGGYGMIGALHCVMTLLSEINRGLNDA